MPRPALIIGVGGTGSWVLSWLKKDLLETYGSLKDLPVRLLLLDTADIIAQVGGAGVKDGSPEDNLGAYSRYNTLDPDEEFQRLPTDPNVELTYEINRQVVSKDKRVEHISTWFAGNYFPDSAYTLRDGAAQFRQLGRLSLVQGLNNQSSSDRVYSGISKLMEQISANAGDDRRQIDVHIAGSFLGGSGSGIFLDLAWLIRKLVPSNTALFITGFFALPGAFTAKPTDAQRMKAFAAWRELNRMMTVKQGETEFQVKWGNAQSVIHDVTKPVYDHVYLLDDSLNLPPTETTFPIMAEAISFFLDKMSGDDYVQHIRANLANRKNMFPLYNNPPYSALYVKSWKLPVFHNLAVARHNFAREFLRRLLQIQENQEINYANRSQVRTVYRLLSDPMYRNRSIEMFNAPLLDTGSTLFIDDLATVSRVAHADYDSKVISYAEDGYNLLQVYSGMPQTPEGIAVEAKISEARDFAVRAIPDTDQTDTLHSYLIDTHEVLYGQQNRGGKRIEYYGDFHGDVYKGKLFTDLEAVEDFQVAVFQRRVQSWMRQELNRIGAQGGRYSGLACVLDALTQLDEDIKFCLRFYTDVKNSLGNVNEAQTASDQWYGDAFSITQTGGFLKWVGNKFGGGPKAAVVSWKGWEEVYLNRQRSHRAVERILSTLRKMGDFITNVALASVRAMEQQLVTDNNFDHISGLYRGLIDSLEDENQRHAYDERLKQVVVLLKNDANIPPVDERKVEELLSRARWMVDDRMSLRLEIAVSPNPDDPPIVLESNLHDPNQTRRLVNQLVQGVASYVVFDDQRQSAGSVLGIDQFRRDLSDVSNPNKLLLRQVTEATPADVRTFYVRAALTEAMSQQLDAALRGLNITDAQPNVVKRVDSENKNKIVVFSARELLLPHQFGEWSMAEAAYHQTVLGDSSKNIDANFDRVKNDHLFRGEQEALRLEHLYFKRGQNQPGQRRDFPTLDQRLVHLLEHRDRLEQFLRLWVLGWVVDQQSDDEDEVLQWRIQFPPETGVRNIVLANRGDGDMLGLLARYVAYGRDIGGNMIPFIEVGTTLEDEMKAIRRDKDASATLKAMYDFEVSSAKRFAALVEDRIRRVGEARPADVRREIDRVLGDLERPERYLMDHGRGYRRALSEEFVYDFATTHDGNPRVTNVNAHLQAMQIVLYFLYTLESDSLQTFRENKGWI